LFSSTACKEGEFKLSIVLGEVDERGPTALFSQEQVARGDFDRLITKIEQGVRRPGIIPRLKNGGKAVAESGI
jgi:hypothetical protein